MRREAPCKQIPPGIPSTRGDWEFVGGTADPPPGSPADGNRLTVEGVYALVSTVPDAERGQGAESVPPPAVV